MADPDQLARLCGWGRTNPTVARVVTPTDEHEVERLLSAPQRGLIARGLGRAYGDAAQCAGGTVVSLAAFDDIGSVASDGSVEVGAGVSLQTLLERCLPQGWFIPVSPGTRQVTVGGAIASDIHGKNHHRDGSFSRHVRSFTLVTPLGVREVTKDDPELFFGTGGAMGLTGVITRATVELIAVETSSMVVDEQRFDDLDAVMDEMTAHDADYRYSVAWVDCAARGKRAGRSVLTRGEHARVEDLAPRKRTTPLVAPGNSRLKVPMQGPAGLLNALSVAAFNEMWFRRARDRRGAIHSIGQYFHPLDGVTDWNLLYGPKGMVQYQFVVDDAHAEVVRLAVQRFSGAGVPSFLAVLKRFGPASPGPLSFPMAGWTLCLDLPLGPPVLRHLLDELDEEVAAAGGRVYFAKDARLRPELVETMYPRLGEFRALRERIDPDGVLHSDLSRRLGLDKVGAA